MANMAYCISTMYDVQPWPCDHGYTFMCPIAVAGSPSQQTIDVDSQIMQVDEPEVQVAAPPPKKKIVDW